MTIYFSYVVKIRAWLSPVATRLLLHYMPMSREIRTNASSWKSPRQKNPHVFLERMARQLPMVVLEMNQLGVEFDAIEVPRILMRRFKLLWLST